MPPKGYRCVSVRAGVFERLRRFADEAGLSISEAIDRLLEYRDIYAKLEQLLQTGVRCHPQAGANPASQQTRIDNPGRASRGSRAQAEETPSGGLRRGQVVECRRGIRNPEVYISRIAEKSGVDLVWIEREPGVVCWASEEEVKRVVEELNEQGLKPGDLPDGHPARDLREHGFIVYDSARGEWEAV